MTERVAPPRSGPAIADVLTAFAAGVTLVTVADGRDDVGTTVSAFCPVSGDPPLVLISLMMCAVFTVFQGRLLPGRDPVAVTAVQFLAATVAALPRLISRNFRRFMGR